MNSFFRNICLAVAMCLGFASAASAEPRVFVFDPPTMVIPAKNTYKIPQPQGVAGGQVQDNGDWVLPMPVNPGAFSGLVPCVTGTSHQWALTMEGAFVTDDPSRRVFCGQLGSDGRAQISADVSTPPVPFWARVSADGGQLVAWQAQDAMRK